ncbi:hypothetical protein D3M61_07110 [Aliarcobacter butzleri]|uniref:hypothetical protein n=1 Tax=Aliarcobacter butzleri TaxID=28197 RepID=UPI00102D9612|nr:hypothetical protein [Aliarcobacter butzleri]RZV13643.1 hypothetical protein D3M61_07110 [Aliarcobacter butzleri]
MAVTELVNKISFVGNILPLEKLNRGLTTSIALGSAAYTSYKAAGLGVQLFVSNTLESIYQTSNLSKELDINIKAMQEWEYIAKMNGSTAEALQFSLGGLSERIGEYAKFDSGEGKEVFEKLGISVKDAEGKIKSADVVMQDLAKSMQGLNVSEQRSIVAKLGIDESMLQTLRLTDEQLNHLKNRANTLGIVTEEQAEQVKKYKNSITDLGYGFDSLRTQIAISLTPALQMSADSFTDFLLNNRELIQNGLNKTTDIISSFASALKNTTGLVYNMIDNTVGFNNVLMLLGATILWVNRAMFLNPLGILIGSAILAIGVIDDLIVAFEGGESVIADFFQEFLNIDIVQVMKDIGSTFDIVIDGIKSGFTDMVNQGKKNFEALKDTVKKIVDNILNFFSPVFTLFDKVSEYNPFSKKIETTINPPNYNDLGNVHPAPNVPITSDNTEKIQLPKLNDNALLPNNIANNTNTATTNNNTQNNNIKIDVKSDNPTIAGQTVVDSLNKQISNANKQFDVGGR